MSHPTRFLVAPGHVTDLPEQDTWPKARHHWDARSLWAVRAAIAAGRPLLIRGEPGIGKSQLARAVAHEAGVPFLYHVVDERTERDDLLFAYDAVARLAEAQVSAMLAREEPKHWRDKLKERNFIRPGVLWWAFDWAGAERQAGDFSDHCRHCPTPARPADWPATRERACGPVVLVDEIDKADPSVPNGLLECLGNRGFLSAQLGEPVRLPDGARPPLVVVTTNEERELPAAFLRRCFVLEMHFPDDPADAERFLIHERARVQWSPDEITDDVCREVIRQLRQERDEARREGLAVPGAAEFLDLVRVLVEIASGNTTKQKEALGDIAGFALRKNLRNTA